MATLADVWSRMFAQGMERAAEAARGGNSSARLRAFANEDILFYVKRHRQPDRGAGGRPGRAGPVLEVDRIGGGGGGAADRRAAAERLWADGGLPDSVAASGGAAAGHRPGVPGAPRGATALARAHAGTGAPAAIRRSCAARRCCIWTAPQSALAMNRRRWRAGLTGQKRLCRKPKPTAV